MGETYNGNLKALLVPYPADLMWEISPRVSSTKNRRTSGGPHFFLETCPLGFENFLKSRGSLLVGISIDAT